MEALGITMICVGTLIEQHNDNKWIRFLGIIIVVSGVYVQNWESLYHA